MKKLINICLIIVVLCLSGCGIKKDTGGQNVDEQEIKYTVINLGDEINNYQDESVDKEYELEHEGQKHYLQYYQTSEELDTRRKVHQYSNDSLMVDINAKTGEIAYVLCFGLLEDGDEKLTEKKLKEKADDIARRYIDVDTFVCEDSIDEYDGENKPYIYEYTYKRYYKESILTGWVEIKVDVYGRERAILLRSINNNHTDKGLEMIDKDTIAKMDEAVIEKAIEKAEGKIKDFRVNRREAIEVDGETRLLYFVDAYDDKGEYASFSWFFEVVW